MPKVRRQNLPPALFQHLLERIQSRKIPATQLQLLATWLDTEPDVPEGEWYKRFSGMTVCGDGQLIKTFLLPHKPRKASAFLELSSAVARSRGSTRPNLNSLIDTVSRRCYSRREI